MPKIKITEIDNTGSTQFTPITNVVYIPGAANAKTEPLYCASISALEGFKGTYGLLDDLSFKLAKRLLRLGMQVVYQGFIKISGSSTWVEGEYFTDLTKKIIPEPEEGEPDFYYSFTICGEVFAIDGDTIVLLGDDSSPSISYPIINGIVTIPEGTDLFEGHAQTMTFDFVGEKVKYTSIKTEDTESLQINSSDWEALSDKSLYDIRFLTTGAYAANATQDMVACATKRGDCVALIDHPISYNSSSVSEIRGYFATFESKFASGFTPWFKTNDEDLGGTKTSVVSIPASFGYLFAYARSIQNNPDWYAVAGKFRGNIQELNGISRKYTSAEVEILQGRSANGEVELDGSGDNIGFAINPIAYVRGYGYLIWGNRTLIYNEDSGDGTGELTASAFLNVRHICIDIVKSLYAAARKYTFEQNSNTLWLNFKHEIQPLLDKMVSGNGIITYTMEQIPTTKKARLSARISITPIEGVEDFELELYLEDSLEVVE